MGTTQSLLKRVVLDALAADAKAEAEAEATLQQVALRLASSSNVSCTLNGAHQMKYVEDHTSDHARSRRPYLPEVSGSNAESLYLLRLCLLCILVPLWYSLVYLGITWYTIHGLCAIS